MATCATDSQTFNSIDSSSGSLAIISPITLDVYHLSLPKMLSGANAFEIGDIERMKT